MNNYYVLWIMKMIGWRYKIGLKNMAFFPTTEIVKQSKLNQHEHDICWSNDFNN